MEKIIWFKLAVKDLQKIHEYISLDSEYYANRFVNQLITRVDQLIEHPECGRIIPEKANPNYREIIHGNYRMFYRIQRKQIQILRIHHSARNIKNKTRP